MIKITINEFLKLKHLTKTQLSFQVGCCISMLSKIQNNQTRITKDFQRKFNAVYPNYQIINGVENWKKKYQDLMAKYNELSNDYKIAKREMNLLKNAISRFNSYIDTATNENAK